MNPRHATRSPAARDPLGTVLGWLWALGMVAGFVAVAALDNGLSDRGTHGLALTKPDPGSMPAQNSPPA